MWVKSFVAGVLPILAASAALAQQACPCGSGTRVVGDALATLLGGRTVCASAGNESWQEFHSGASSGQLIDWKKGPQDPVDPTEAVGSWQVGNDLVTYTYGSTSYAYSVCTVPGETLNFCSASRNVTGATVRNGQVSCSGSAAAQLLRGSRPASPLPPLR